MHATLVLCRSPDEMRHTAHSYLIDELLPLDERNCCKHLYLGFALDRGKYSIVKEKMRVPNKMPGGTRWTL